MNIGGEEQKSGAAIAGVPELLRAVREMSPLHVSGLMAIPPAVEAE